MFKTMTFIKRRPDLSFEEFHRYYEETHAPIGKELMPQARYYARRYVTPAPYPLTGEIPESDFDVVTEVWCDSREAYEEMLAGLMEPATIKLITDDERNFIDQSRTRLYYEEECDTSVS